MRWLHPAGKDFSSQKFTRATDFVCGGVRFSLPQRRRRHSVPGRISAELVYVLTLVNNGVTGSRSAAVSTYDSFFLFLSRLVFLPPSSTASLLCRLLVYFIHIQRHYGFKSDRQEFSNFPPRPSLEIHWISAAADSQFAIQPFRFFFLNFIWFSSSFIF